MSIKDKLIHAVTEYDRKQSTKRGYNSHALGIYLERVDAICADIEAGAPVRMAIIAGFSDRLVDACLKAVGEAKSTIEESQGNFIYVPVKAKA